ncbi:hypothetical protein [Leptolyngbya sp. FACHB-16]|uniref:hypothetical protein n=1 Tax=unclassified Leptolyngbya TaxID=2650499 RepID=UPI001688E42D|nr:hypothetical protein [Leptolyngbya sp. FACHB-16]MBD2156024.1 hypothetical protein [Leptolyngbya sp. FACHB-16]
MYLFDGTNPFATSFTRLPLPTLDTSTVSGTTSEQTVDYQRQLSYSTMLTDIKADLSKIQSDVMTSNNTQVWQ